MRAVAAANPRTVVLVNAGSPVLMPWRDEVAAVLVGCFGGQEFGDAVADVLLGVGRARWPPAHDLGCRPTRTCPSCPRHLSTVRSTTPRASTSATARGSSTTPPRRTGSATASATPTSRSPTSPSRRRWPAARSSTAHRRGREPRRARRQAGRPGVRRARRVGRRPSGPLARRVRARTRRGGGEHDRRRRGLDPAARLLGRRAGPTSRAPTRSGSAPASSTCRSTRPWSWRHERASEPAGPGLQPRSERGPGRRHLLPGDLDVRVPARPADLPQHRPGRVDPHRQRRHPPGAGGRGGRAHRGGVWAPTIRSPRRGLLPHRHHRDERAWVRRLHRDRPRGSVERRHDHRRRRGHRPRPRVGRGRQRLRDVLGPGHVRRGPRQAPRHPAGPGRPRGRQGDGGAALAVVRDRTEVPRGAARLPARRALVPDDRRGRHRARPRRELRPRPVDRGPVREPPGQPAAERAQHLAADPEHRPRRPRRHPRRRLRADHAGHAAARGDPVVLPAGPRDVHHRRGLGRRLAAARAGPAGARGPGSRSRTSTSRTPRRSTTPAGWPSVPCRPRSPP